jgi:hypothetical protein
LVRMAFARLPSGAHSPASNPKPRLISAQGHSSRATTVALLPEVAISAISAPGLWALQTHSWRRPELSGFPSADPSGICLS